MGDALQAIPTIALSADRNVIGFIGDGAAMLGPDVIPAFVEHTLHTGIPPAGSTVIFILANGGHSLIATYQEGRLGQRAGRQMRLPWVVPDDTDVEVAGLRISRRTVREFDESQIRSALAARGTVTVFTVLLAHTNGGDGLSLMDVGGWERPEPVSVVGRRSLR
jgi:hypothetical protein